MQAEWSLHLLFGHQTCLVAMTWTWDGNAHHWDLRLRGTQLGVMDKCSGSCWNDNVHKLMLTRGRVGYFVEIDIPKDSADFQMPLRNLASSTVVSRIENANMCGPWRCSAQKIGLQRDRKTIILLWQRYQDDLAI
jgi:hypothetical protein